MLSLPQPRDQPTWLLLGKTGVHSLILVAVWSWALVAGQLSLLPGPPGDRVGEGSVSILTSYTHVHTSKSTFMSLIYIQKTVSSHQVPFNAKHFIVALPSSLAVRNLSLFRYVYLLLSAPPYAAKLLLLLSVGAPLTFLMLRLSCLPSSPYSGPSSCFGSFLKNI